MNTITTEADARLIPISTEQIEAVLDPLLRKLAAAFPDACLVSIDRQCWYGRDIQWRAGNCTNNEVGSTPAVAVHNLVASVPEKLVQKRIDLEQKLADTKSQLAALQAQEAMTAAEPDANCASIEHDDKGDN